MVSKGEKQKAPKPVAPTCDICCETLNKTTRRFVNCPYCQKGSCMQCAKTYLCTTVNDTHCMHCKVRWNSAFVRDTFPNAWLSKEYRNMREKILFDTEVSKIPDTQKFCDASKKRAALIKEKEVLYLEIKEAKEVLVKKGREYEECNQDIWILNEDMQNRTAAAPAERLPVSKMQRTWQS